jgi:membrane dipeptidase
MASRAIGLALSVLTAMAAASCRSDSISPATKDQIRQSHDRMLTIDGNARAGDIPKFLARMRAGGLDAVVFVVPMEDDGATGSNSGSRQSAVNHIREIKTILEQSAQLCGLALRSGDAYRLQRENRRAVYIGLEISAAARTTLEFLPTWHAEGARILVLGGEAESMILDPAQNNPGDEVPGLAPSALELVAKCERLGLVVALAGCSERTVRSVLRESPSPIVVSRAAARALCDRPGNLSDELIREIGENGGVILVPFEPARLRPVNQSGRAAIVDIVDHIEHIARVAGVDVVGIGSGFGAGGGVADCRDPGDILGLTMELLRRGFGENQVERIWGGNLMRLFKQVETAAGE